MADEQEAPQEKKEGSWIADSWHAAASSVSGYGAGLWGFVWAELAKALPDIWGRFFDAWKGQVEKSEEFDKEMVDAWEEKFSVKDPDLRTEIEEAKKLMFPIGFLYATYLRFLYPLILAKEKIRLSVLPAAFDAAQKTQSQIPPIETVLREWFRSPEDRNQLRDYLEQHNFGGVALDTLTKATRNFGDVQTILSLRNRGWIHDDDMAEEYIRKLGFEAADAKLILQLRDVIPPINDIIRMAVREAFDPEAVRTFHLDDHYPQVLTEWANKQGLSEEWAKNYWRAHWVLPSLSQGFEMLWRTDFNDEDLDLLMRTADVSPYFRPYLKQIAYHPYTRVDVRRMYDLGVLGEADLLQAYKDLGFDEEKAQNMVKFTIRYVNKSSDKTLVKRLLWAAEHGIIEWSEAEASIALLLGDEDEAALMRSQAEAEWMQALLEKKEGRIKRLYVGRRIDYGKASDELDKLGMNATAKADTLEDWEEERKAKTRYPSKADLGKYLKLGVITPEQFSEQMEQLGFDTKFIEWEMLAAGAEPI